MAGENGGTQGSGNQPDPIATRLDQLSAEFGQAMQAVRALGAGQVELARRFDAQAETLRQPAAPPVNLDDAGKKLQEEWFRDPMRVEANRAQAMLNEVERRVEQKLSQEREVLNGQLFWTQFWQANPDLSMWGPMVEKAFNASQNPDPAQRAMEAAQSVRQLVFAQSQAIQQHQQMQLSQEEEMRRRSAASGAYGGAYQAGVSRTPEQAQSHLERMHAAVDGAEAVQKQRMQRNWRIGQAAA